MPRGWVWCNVGSGGLSLWAVWWTSYGEVCEVMLPRGSRASVGRPALVGVPLGQVVLKVVMQWKVGCVCVCVCVHSCFQGHYPNSF